MSGWRSKLIFLLIVYFGGFATAIYMLAPAPKNAKPLALGSLLPSRTGQAERITSEEFVESFNTGMHKAFAFGKVAALHTAKFIREKLKEMPETRKRAPN
ncbi:MAG TPA: hypothetical protein VMW24_11350 [Sedimentisphaerales bacterium]|nr:hypothetical protein [Sedimentisphaerales bacterium]